MKKLFLFFTFIFLATNLAKAETVTNDELCNASDACKKVCNLKALSSDEDQDLINKCSADIVTKFNLD